MSIVNRRNAIFGWAVWQIGKTAAKRKATQAAKQATQTDDRRPGKRTAAIASGLAATGGALLVWRRRRGDDES